MNTSRIPRALAFSSPLEGVRQKQRPGLSALRGVLAVAAIALLGLPGCEYLGGRSAVVEFSSVEGLRSGDPVYFAGVLIGRTEEPRLVQGRAHVPVQLMRRHKDALPETTVFAISTVPGNGEHPCLVAYDVGSVLPAGAKASDGTYRGFSNELELTMVVGAQKAKEFVDSLSPPQR